MRPPPSSVPRPPTKPHPSKANGGNTAAATPSKTGDRVSPDGKRRRDSLEEDAPTVAATASTEEPGSGGKRHKAGVGGHDHGNGNGNGNGNGSVNGTSTGSGGRNVTAANKSALVASAEDGVGPGKRSRDEQNEDEDGPGSGKRSRDEQNGDGATEPVSGGKRSRSGGLERSVSTSTSSSSVDGSKEDGEVEDGEIPIRAAVPVLGA